MKTILTIGRQFGSGGREIGQKIAQHYGINFYDKELLARVAKESGFCEDIVKQQDERPTSSFLYNLVMDTYSFGYNSASFADMPISQKVFLSQFDTIKKIADEEHACVFIGRCADNALSDRDNVINVFIHASEERKLNRILSLPDQYGEFENRQKARDAMIKKDRQRQSFYNYYSLKKWGRADTYNLTIDAGLLGIDGTVRLLEHVIDDFENKE